MRLVLLGPPGAGKGTQAVVLSNNYDIIHVSSGDLLREAVKNKTEAGNLAKSFMDKGELVPDDVVTEIVAERLSKSDAKKGFILDGFPRNEKQAFELAKQLKKIGEKLDLVLFFKTMGSTVIERLAGRRVCPKCGLNFHIKTRPPKKRDVCDTCGSTLISRDDDKAETIKYRLKVYERQTRPLLSYYKKEGILREVMGDLNVDDLFKELKELFVNEKLT